MIPAWDDRGAARTASNLQTCETGQRTGQFALLLRGSPILTSPTSRSDLNFETASLCIQNQVYESTKQEASDKRAPLSIPPQIGESDMVKAQKAAVGLSEGCVDGSCRSIGIDDDGNLGPWILIAAIGAMCFTGAAWAFTSFDIEPYIVS